MKRTLRTILALASFALFALAPRVEAIPLLSVGSATHVVGDTFTIPVSITGAVDLTSFQFDLSFVPAILQAILQADFGGATAGAFLPGDWFFTSTGAVDNTLGLILGVSASGSAISGSGVLANIEFTASSAGTSPLMLSSVAVNLFEDFTVANGQVCVDTPSAPTCPQAVPEPGTVALFAMGLGLLAWRRRLTRTR